MEPTKVVDEFYRTMAEKDKLALRAVLADDFTFKGPMMAFNNPDAFVEGMMSMPFSADIIGSRFIADRSHVVHVFVWSMTAPTNAAIPMCEVISLRDDKVLRSELYFDTKLFPAN